MSLDSVTNVNKFSEQPLMLEKSSFIFLTMLTENVILKTPSPLVATEINLNC